MNKNLGNMQCNSGYDKVSGTSFHNNADIKTDYKNTLIIIDDENTYKAKYPYAPDSMPFGVIDFTDHSIVCVKVETNMASSVENQGFLCHKSNPDDWVYTVEYSLSDQCKGSGISRLTFSASLICDKLPTNAAVQLKLVDINPF